MCGIGNGQQWFRLKTNIPYFQKVKNIFGANLLAYFPIWEPSGTTATDQGGNGRNGTYTSVSLAQAGIGDGRTAGLFNNNAVLNARSTSLANAFSGTEGTFSCWLKLNSAAIWTDATRDYILQITAGGDEIWIRKNSTDNLLQAAHIANGTAEVSEIPLFAQTGWFNYTLTWSVSGNAVKAYINGVALGTVDAGIGTWAGGAPTLMAVGAASLGLSQPWNGYMAHVMFADRALTQPEVYALSSYFDASPPPLTTATLLPSGYYGMTSLGAVLYACKTTRHVAKSTDFGSSWTDFSKLFAADLSSVFVSKDGILVACAGTTLWRSTDDGANWTSVQTLAVGAVTTWGWAQAPGGNIFAGEYSLASNSIYVWISTDNGATWTRKDGLHALSDKHVHQVFVDPETSRLYVTIGDTPRAIYYSDDNAATWTQLFATQECGFTGATSMAGARFFADDLELSRNRVWKTTNDSALAIAWSPDWRFNTSYGDIVYVDGGNTLFCTFSNEESKQGQKSVIAKSTDAGATWVPIVSSSTYHFTRPAYDYRHRIPSTLGYLICECIENQQMIRIPV